MLTIPQVLDERQVIERDMTTRFQGLPGMGEPLTVVRGGFMVDGAAPLPVAAAAGARRAYGRGFFQPAAARQESGREREKKTGRERGEEWWQTGIIEMSPGIIRLRGYEIQDLIGRVSFPATIWLMLRGELPSEEQAALLGIALGAAVDHGPQAPSIAIARMAITCGVGINSAMASAVNVLGDVHGGAGEQALSFYGDIAVALDAGCCARAKPSSARLDRFFAEEKGYVPGFGHRFHPVDPRAPRLIEVTRDFAARGVVSGRFADIAEAVEAEVARRKGKKIPLNIDGATAVIYGELGFPPPLTRGLFVLSRSVGILAHAWEQSQQSERNKGPLPREWLWAYTGTPVRPFPRRRGRRRARQVSASGRVGHCGLRRLPGLPSASKDPAHR